MYVSKNTTDTARFRHACSISLHDMAIRPCDTITDVTDAQIGVGAIISAIVALGGVVVKAIRWSANRIVASHDRSTHALIQSARSEATTQAMLMTTQATLTALASQIRGAQGAPNRTSTLKISEVERSRQRRTSPRGLPRLKSDSDK
jgi:hypothetical protein